MTGHLSTGPRVAYLDTCVPSAIVKGELSSADSQAVARLGQLVQSSAVTLWTSTVMLGYGDWVPCAFVSWAWIGHAAPNTATNTMFPQPIALPVFLRIDCLLFDVNFAHGAPFSVTSAAWKWVLPNAEKVGMSLPRFGGRKADALLGAQEGQSM